MSGSSSSVPPPAWSDQGFIVPQESDVLNGVLQDMQAAFGGTLNTALETPQGQLASSLTAIIADKNDQFLALTQGVDPAYASGRMQDAIARIYFIERNPAQSTTVTATCTGLAGVLIPAGALAVAADGNTYASSLTGRIGSGGTVDLPFFCLTTGPITCPAGTLTTIAQIIPGWDSITNASDGVVGNDVETRVQFEARRQGSVAKNSLGMLASLQGAVLAVADVVDSYITENFTASPVTSDGVTIPAHALYVCVAGGAAADIAYAIWSRKPPGCGMAGGTTAIVEDDQGGYADPVPTYTITWQTAVPQPFVVVVTLANTANVPSTASALVQTAVLAAWAGSDGGQRARIGSTVYASRFYRGVAALGTWADIISIKLGSSAAPSADIQGSISSTTLTVSAVNSGSLAIGQFLRGSGIPDGVRLTAGSGASWTVSQALSTPSQTFTTITGNLDQVAAGIAHVPVLAAPDVVTVLQ